MVHHSPYRHFGVFFPFHLYTRKKICFMNFPKLQFKSLDNFRGKNNLETEIRHHGNVTGYFFYLTVLDWTE